MCWCSCSFIRCKLQTVFVFTFVSLLLEYFFFFFWSSLTSKHGRFHIPECYEDSGQTDFICMLSFVFLFYFLLWYFSCLFICMCFFSLVCIVPTVVILLKRTMYVQLMMCVICYCCCMHIFSRKYAFHPNSTGESLVCVLIWWECVQAIV